MLITSLKVRGSTAEKVQYVLDGHERFKVEGNRSEERNQHRVAEAVKFSSAPSLCRNKFFHVLVQPQHRLQRPVQDLAPAPFFTNSTSSS